ncbi:MAG: universal stress protein, partial [Gammaproteobacteria bacterium]
RAGRVLHHLVRCAAEQEALDAAKPVIAHDDEIDWPTPHVAVEVREGEDVSSAILDASDELDIDMIVIGDKGTGAIRKFLLGSVTRRIAHHAPCSVLVVREPARSRAS